MLKLKKGISLIISAAITLSAMQMCVVTTHAEGFSFGSSETELAAGEYTLPLAMMNAGDITKTSMAGSCIKDAVLNVGTGGSAEVTVNLQAVTVGTITDWASQWKIYKTNAPSGETVDAEEHTNDDGNVDSITFDVPDTSLDGVYVNMFVTAMNRAVDAYLAFDYTSATSSGASDVKTYSGTAQVQQFGKYDINTVVTVADGKITGVEITGDNFGGNSADYNKTKLQAAIDGLKDWWNGKTASQDNAKELYEIDAVSSATVSSNTIRDAVLDALDITYEPEAEITVPENVEPGVYEVEIAYNTETVNHSVVGGGKVKAKLTSYENGTVTLDFDIPNGTEKEPLYVLDFNGYYTDNDRSKALTTEGAEVTKGAASYSDEYLTEDSKVVTHITMPLAALAENYNTNLYLYVPAMNALNGEQAGITFDHGRFNIDSVVKVYWNELTRTGDVPADVTQDGSYSVNIALWNAAQDTASMGNAAFTENPKAVITTEGGVSKIRIRTNPVTMGSIKSALENMQFENANRQWQYVTDVKKASLTANDGTADHEMEYLKELEFVLPSADEEYVPVKIKVPYTPMGDEYINARLKLDWSTLAKYDDTITINSVAQQENGVKVNITNNGIEADADVIAALYDDKHKLINVKVNKNQQLANGSEDVTFEGVTEQYGEIKIFVWDSVENMKPLAENFESCTGYGSEHTELAAGSYSVPVSMMKSTDITSPSMAASAIGAATLTVAADGTATITVKINPVTVTFGGNTTTAYSYGWQVYQTYGTDGEKAAAEYTTDENEHVNSITFTVPDNSWDGVYVSMSSGGPRASDAYLAIDYTNAAEITD